MFELDYNGNGLRCHLDDDSFWQKFGNFFTKEVCKIRFDLKVEDVVLMLPYNGPCLKVFLCV
jgi:hypothetical protein